MNSHINEQWAVTTARSREKCKLLGVVRKTNKSHTLETGFDVPRNFPPLSCSLNSGPDCEHPNSVTPSSSSTSKKGGGRRGRNQSDTVVQLPPPKAQQERKPCPASRPWHLRWTTAITQDQSVPLLLSTHQIQGSHHNSFVLQLLRVQHQQL